MPEPQTCGCHHQSNESRGDSTALAARIAFCRQFGGDLDDHPHRQEGVPDRLAGIQRAPAALCQIKSLRFLFLRFAEDEDLSQRSSMRAGRFPTLLHPKSPGGL